MGHSRKDLGPPHEGWEDLTWGTGPDEPHPSLALPASSGSRGEPPLPFLRRGIIAAHDAAGVIAAGLGARAALAFSPPTPNPPPRAQEIICPLLPPRNTGGHRATPIAQPRGPSRLG